MSEDRRGRRGGRWKDPLPGLYMGDHAWHGGNSRLCKVEREKWVWDSRRTSHAAHHYSIWHFCSYPAKYPNYLCLLTIFVVEHRPAISECKTVRTPLRLLPPISPYPIFCLGNSSAHVNQKLLFNQSLPFSPIRIQYSTLLIAALRLQLRHLHAQVGALPSVIYSLNSLYLQFSESVTSSKPPFRAVPFSTE